MALRGTYSATGGVDLSPAYNAQKAALMERQFQEDMRRALSGEKLAASELELRREQMGRMDQREIERQALQKALQTQELDARRAENEAQRGFQREEGGLDRAFRGQMQGQDIAARRAMQSQDIEARESMQLRDIAESGRRFDMQFELAKQQNDREAARSVLENQALAYENMVRAVDAEPDSLEKRRKLSQLQLQQAELQNRAAEQGIKLAERRDMREGAQLEMESDRNRQALERGQMELEAGRKAMAEPRLSAKDEAILGFLGRDLTPQQRAKLLTEVLGDDKLAARAEALFADKGAKVEGPDPATGMTAKEVADFKELSRLETEDAIEHDTQRIHLGALKKLAELGPGTDEATEGRRKKLRALAELSQKVEQGDLSDLRPSAMIAFGVLGTVADVSRIIKNKIQRMSESEQQDLLRKLAEENGVDYSSFAGRAFR